MEGSFLQTSQDIKVDRMKYIADILHICCDERYQKDSTFLKTPFKMPFLNPLQEFLNGYKEVPSDISF